MTFNHLQYVRSVRKKRNVELVRRCSMKMNTKIILINAMLNQVDIRWFENISIYYQAVLDENKFADHLSECEDELPSRRTNARTDRE